MRRWRRGKGPPCACAERNRSGAFGSQRLYTVGGSLGFLFALGSQGIEWSIAGALLVGGIIAAPFAAWLVKILPAKVLAIAAGGIIILTNARTISLALGASTPVVSTILAALALGWISLLIHVVRLERRTRRAEAAAEPVGAEA